MRRRTIPEQGLAIPGWLYVRPGITVPPSRCSWCGTSFSLMGTPASHARVCLPCDFTVTSLTSKDVDA